MKVDNTMLLQYQDCPLKYKTRIEDWWTSRFRSGALGAGGAMHEGLKAWYQGSLDGLSLASRIEMAVAAIQINWPENQPADDFRTLARAQELMIRYIKEYPSETFKILQVEVPFKFELGRCILWCKECNYLNPPCGPGGLPRETCQSCGKPLEQIEYGGIFDLLTAYVAGTSSVVYVGEHKTTSQLGAMYFHQYYLSNQVTGYVWGAGQVSGKVVGGALINALCLTTGGNMKFAREMVHRNPSDIERWKNDVADTCNAIATSQRTGIWRMHTNNCMGKYGQCEFHSVHILSNPDEQRRRLETDYKKEEWNFEKRDDPATVTP
jgi:hypothetical protein